MIKIGDEVYIHGYVDEIRKDVIIIRNEGGYFGTVLDEIKSKDKPQTDGYISGEDFMKIFDQPQTDYKMPYEDCEDCETHLKAQYGDCNKCKWYGDKQVCGRCRSRNLYASKDEPQTVSLTSAHISGDTYHKVENEPHICDFCRYYNSNIPCGSTPSACKEADKFAEEFIDGLKKLKSKDKLQTSKIIEAYAKGFEDGADAVKAMPQTLYIDKSRGYTLKADTNDVWKPKTKQTEREDKR